MAMGAYPVFLCPKCNHQFIDEIACSGCGFDLEADAKAGNLMVRHHSGDYAVTAPPAYADYYLRKIRERKFLPPEDADALVAMVKEQAQRLTDLQKKLDESIAARTQGAV